MDSKNIEEWTKLADFLKKRGNIPTNTAATYIKRHQKDFEGHTRRRSSKTPLYIDSVAAELLDEVYPLQEVTVVEGVPQAEYDELKAKYEGLVSNISEMSKLLVEAQQQVVDANKALIDIQKSNQLLIDQNQELNQKQERLRSRGLIDRILNRE